LALSPDLAELDVCYVTGIGRTTGRPHRIEIWFAAAPDRDTIFMLSGGRDRADWVRNIKTNGRVTVDLGDESHAGLAHVVGADTAEDQLARDLLVGKYADSEDDLAEWGRTSLPVVIEFAQMQA